MTSSLRASESDHKKILQLHFSKYLPSFSNHKSTPKTDSIHRSTTIITMSNSTSSYSSYTSQSYSSSTNGSGHSYSEATVSDPSGTTIHRTSQESGQPAISETTRLPAGGTAAVGGGADNGRRIEDVTDADREYEERMEDEYAKREGGA